MVSTRSVSWLRHATVVVCTLALAGCAQPRNSLDRYVERDDPCRSYRATIAEVQTDFRDWAIGGAAIGAITGGILGGLLGDTEGALIGAAAGGALGGTGGYLAARQRQAQTDAELQAAIEGDAATDSHRVREIKAAVNGLSDCRRDQIAKLRTDYRAGRFTREETRARAAAIEAAMDRDDELISEALGRAGERLKTYADARAEIAGPEDPEPKPPLPEPREVALPPETLPLEAETEVFVVRERSNVRSAPTTEAAVLGRLDPGSTVMVTGRTVDGAWYATSYEAQPAFVYASRLDVYQPADAVREMDTELQKARVARETERRRAQRDLENLEILL